MRSARSYSRVYFSFLTLKKCFKNSIRNERKRKPARHQRYKSSIMKTIQEIRRQSSRILNQIVRIKMIRFLKAQLNFLYLCLPKSPYLIQKSMRKIV